MNATERRTAAMHHLVLAAMYAHDGSRQWAADHAERASQLLQPLPSEADVE